MYFEPSKKTYYRFPLLLVSMIWINDIIFLRKIATQEKRTTSTKTSTRIMLAKKNPSTIFKNSNQCLNEVKHEQMSRVKDVKQVFYAFTLFSVIKENR